MARPRQITDEQILEEARRCFLEHGPSVSTEVVAGRLQISQAVLFKRFRTKEELLIAALRPDPDPAWVRIVEEGPDERPLREQLRQLAPLVTAWFDEIVPCIAVLRASSIDLRRLVTPGCPLPPVRAQRAV
ncbi:MAG: TetR/AcrR family transcriptional regulator, partial [Myxococcales bacterium]